MRMLIFACFMLLSAFPALAQTSPQPAFRGMLRFRFHVAWEILRSGFNNTLDVALEADTYGESWLLEIVNPYEIYLSTPRGKARVIGLKVQAGTPSDAVCDTLVIQERDLATLLGIEVEALNPSTKEIFLDLPITTGDEQSFILKANPQYFVSVSLNIQL